MNLFPAGGGGVVSKNASGDAEKQQSSNLKEISVDQKWSDALHSDTPVLLSSSTQLPFPLAPTLLSAVTDANSLEFL